jgi:hypothetical protein
MKETQNSLIPRGKKIDLSNRELIRTYVFPGGDKVIIENPQFLIISDNGHRIGAEGASHYIPYGWIHLWWVCHPERKDNFYCESPESCNANTSEEPKK